MFYSVVTRTKVYENSQNNLLPSTTLQFLDELF